MFQNQFLIAFILLAPTPLAFGQGAGDEGGGGWPDESVAH